MIYYSTVLYKKKNKMNDFTIYKILQSKKETRDHFIGVFSADTLPSYAQTGYYVVNLDPRTSQEVTG